MKRIIGIAMICCFFIGLIVIISATTGIKPAIIILLSAIGITGWIVISVYLIVGEGPSDPF